MAIYEVQIAEQRYIMARLACRSVDIRRYKQRCIANIVSTYVWVGIVPQYFYPLCFGLEKTNNATSPTHRRHCRRYGVMIR